MTAQPFASDYGRVLLALVAADRSPFVLEEIAATAAVSFEGAWYAVLELIEKRFMSPAGVDRYVLIEEGQEAASRLTTEMGGFESPHAPPPNKRT